MNQKLSTFVIVIVVSLFAFGATACSSDEGDNTPTLGDGTPTNVDKVSYRRVEFTNQDGTLRVLDCLYFGPSAYAGGPWCEEPKR